MQIQTIANILRFVGAGILIVGIYQKMQPVWIIGVIVMLAGTIMRMVLRYRTSKSDN